jgi:glycosyltransferase involved in cell wall biosynthesis
VTVIGTPGPTAAAPSSDLVASARSVEGATRLRVYDSLRSAHLERAKELEPAAIVFRRRRYDFDDRLALGLALRQVTTVQALVLAARSRAEEIEVNEPLSPGSGLAVAALLGLGLRRLLGRPRAIVTTYAIENLDPSDVPRTGVRARLRAALLAISARVLWRRLDRIVFGTGASRRLYETRFPQRTGLAATIIPALPVAKAVADDAKRAGSVVFLGALVQRKGFPLLLDAWPEVLRAHPQATLTIIGKGALLAEAAALAEADASVRLLEDPPRSRIFEELEAMQVLVLPSQPTPKWREQVGLPLVEGLASGCSVVTTDETGIADWLGEHGHAVIPASSGPDRLAAAIIAQLSARRSATSVLADLPAVDGRLAADRWLFGGGR